jgi:hydroxypyruvate isomerase
MRGIRMFPKRFAANLSTLWTDLEPIERFVAAATAGFRSVEMLFPQDLEADDVIAVLSENALELVLFDFNAGDWSAGERGIAALPDRIEEFRTNAVRDLEHARAFGTALLAVLAGKRPESCSREEATATLIDNLRYVADLPEAAGITVTLEAINGHDVPGYHVRHVAEAANIVRAVDRPNVRLQFDQYHVCREEQDPIDEFRLVRDLVAHVQIADAPGRHEPGSGEAPITAFLEQLATDGYGGFVGLEYIPSGATVHSLGWLDEYR